MFGNIKINRNIKNSRQKIRLEFLFQLLHLYFNNNGEAYKIQTKAERKSEQNVEREQVLKYMI